MAWHRDPYGPLYGDGIQWTPHTQSAAGRSTTPAQAAEKPQNRTLAAILIGLAVVLFAAASLVAPRILDNISRSVADAAYYSSPAWQQLTADWNSYSATKQASICAAFGASKEEAWGQWQSENYTRPVEIGDFLVFMWKQCGPSPSPGTS